MDKKSNPINESHNIEQPDRREILKMCAAAITAAALGNVVTGCAPTSSPSSDQLFQGVDLKKLQGGIDEVSRMMLGFREETTTNGSAWRKMNRILNQVGLHDAALAGPEAPVDQFGHGVIFNAGKRGFLSTRVYGDSKFVLPLIIQKGIDTSTLDTRGAGTNGCTWTEGKCTGIVGDGCETDAGADDDALGWGVIDFDAFRLQRVDYFDINDILIYQAIMRQSVDIFISVKSPSQLTLNAWLASRKGINQTRHT